jgi:hypothetical protein
MYVRFLLVLAFVSLLVFPLSGPALAVKPDQFSGESDAAGPVYDCGDFWIVEDAHMTYTVTTFYDKDGNYNRDQVQFTYQGTFTNSVTGKSVVDGPDHQTYIYYADDTSSTHGLVISINVPGAGVIGLDAGTISFDENGQLVFASGPHHLVGDGYVTDFTQVCEALR